MFGNEERHFIIKMHAFCFGFFLQNGNAHFEFWWLDLYCQTPVKTGNQTIIKAVDVFRVGIASDDDLLAGFDQRVEQEEKLFLGAIFAIKKLHVIKQKHIERTVSPFETIE
ncbi:MAG: hypothetical protein ACD_10C00066G0002 [uncultured bacterium]|nr:MAG: hypothetical protein ACD_10C00066G0002 [uncultured bacterium]